MSDQQRRKARTLYVLYLTIVTTILCVVFHSPAWILFTLLYFLFFGWPDARKR